LPAADNAGMKASKYDPRLHMVGIPCAGPGRTPIAVTSATHWITTAISAPR